MQESQEEDKEKEKGDEEKKEAAGQEELDDKEEDVDAKGFIPQVGLSCTCYVCDTLQSSYEFCCICFSADQKQTEG